MRFDLTKIQTPKRRKMVEQLLEEFYDWLVRKGYSISYARKLKEHTRIIINNIGIHATVDDIATRYRNYRPRTRSNLRIAWRRFQEFLDEIGNRKEI